MNKYYIFEMFFKSVMIIFLLFCNEKCYAYILTPSREPERFIGLGPSIRSLAMGDVFTAIADDPYAIYLNPAGLNQIDNLTLNISNPKSLIIFS